MKTETTRAVEVALWEHMVETRKIGAMEVQFSFNRTGRPGVQIVDWEDSPMAEFQVRRLGLDER